MLQQLRVASKSWVASVIIGVLVLAFALWGVADIFHGGNDTVVADVGKATIPSAEFDREFKNQIRTLSEQTQTQISVDQAKALGLDRNVLDTAISRTAIDEEGRELGLTVSRTAIAADIHNDHNFFGAGGAFDPGVFASTLRDQGLSEDAYVAIVGDNLTRSQLLTAATDGIAAPPGLTRLLFDYTSEQRTAEYLVITPDQAGPVPEPSVADLDAFRKAHPQQFSSPEYRAFDYVGIGPDDVANEITITDADIKAEYDAHQSDYVQPESRDIEQIAFPSKDAADAAAAKIKSGGDFAAIAKERGLKDADVELGAKTAAQLDPKLSAAVFAVPQGGVTDPVQGPFGWVLLRAAKVTPGQTKTLDELRDAIKTQLVKARSASKVTDLVNAFEDARGSGQSLEDAAKKVGLTVHHVAAADHMGLTPEDAKADIPSDGKFIDSVFMTESGEESEAFQTEDGQNYAVKITGVTQPALRPLDAVREVVRAGFLKDARAKLLVTRMRALADEAMHDGSLAGVAKAVGGSPVTTMPMRRDKTDDVFAAELTAKLFAVQPHGVVTGPAAKGDGYVIALVDKVDHPPADVTSAQYADFRKAAASQLAQTLVEGLAEAARVKEGVTIHQATLRQVLGDTAQ